MAPEDASDASQADGAKGLSTDCKGDHTAADGTGDGGRRLVDRRSLLHTGGAAISALATAGLAGSAAGQVTRHGVSFDRVVDAVDDLGMDPSGNEPIDGALDGAMRSGTLIEFPPGEYLVAAHHSTSGLARFGVRGLGDHRNDVRFRPPSGSGVGFMVSGGQGPWLIEHVSFDELSDDASTIFVDLGSSRGGYVRDVEWLGRSPLDDATDYHVNADVYDQDATIVFEEVYAGLDEPSVPATYPRGIAFLRAGPGHRGEIVIRECAIHERNSAATRMEAGPGVVTVEDTEFVNNQNANIRFSGGRHPTKRSSVDGAYVKVDGSRNVADAVRIGGSQIGPVFRNLVIDWSKDSGRGCIAAPGYDDPGGAEFTDCIVRNDGASTPTVRASSTSHSNSAFVFENCDFTGTGGGFHADGRPGSVVRDSCIDMPNASISGFATRNVSRSGCRLPEDFDGGDGSDGGDDGSDGGEDGSGGETPDVENTLTVRGAGTPTNFRIGVSGELVELDDSLERHDTVDGSTAEGWVTTAEHVDAFGYDGEVTDFEILEGGPVDVTRNGEPVSVAELSGNEEPSATISVTDTDGLSVTLSAGDSSDSDGTVASYRWDVDGSEYTGETASHTFPSPGPYDVTLVVEDDEGATATASTSVTVEHPHELRVRGTGNTTQYVVEVDGDVEPVADTVEAWDDVTDDAATGWVTTTEDVDVFTFDGEVTDVEFLQGEAAVSVDGERIDGPATEHALRIRGTGTTTQYAVEVSDAIEPVDDTVEPWDDVTDDAATGWVTTSEDVDEFVFEGELTALEFQRGEAAVSVDGERVHPSDV